MATTNYVYAESFQKAYPNTFGALQQFVMALADFVKNAGKKTIWGKDKGKAAFQKVIYELGRTILAMSEDEIIKQEQEPETIREELVRCLELFEATFPNWPDAYALANEILVEDKDSANAMISDLIQ